MKVFLDSSAFAKRYIEEAGSQLIDEICQQASELCLSVICIPELISALNRRVREKILSQKNYTTIKKALSEDVQDITVINLTPEVITQATRLLENNTLRAMDALHIACALECKTELFVSFDKQQIVAAQNAGLITRVI
ncbi:MAG TPA: type II toxin-antitoxin system VapC family toxin [Desulfobacteraceae bacterium]|nr:type II toxin-antitoxin system VapC family toxin [Desulfobacteraceae bacterium]HPJ67638.1 type II toxin-antitoxin system VapC family toxin [Desulfobacteraceae bacterium]HPQ29430.1 type II toxin-antitoxin system VapC family toxin [Desulfobacteraceae bacterium]